jgi:predicted O-methyltransferase YrrM
MEIVNNAIEQYLRELSPVIDPVLAEMEKLAEPSHFPIVGPLVGRLLYQLTLITGARRVFEMGSGFGYSAYWFAKALPPDGRIFCTEGSRDRAQLAKEFFARGGLERKLHLEVGDALEIIDRTPGEFDIIFNDIDKEFYPAALQKALPRLRKGGLLISDNVLWSGRVVEGDTAPSTRGVREYNQLVFTSQELFTTIVPVRDGVSISVKM